MRLPFYTIGLPILAAVAFAQNTPPQQPPASTAPATAAPATATADSQKQSGERPQEMKTLTYSGDLLSASCAGSDAAVTASSSTTPAPPSADRAAGSGCAVTATTTQFALKMKDGKTVRFDDVGNARVQEAMKSHKSWSDSASSSKPIRVTAKGVLSGDKLIVLSVH